jgi:L-methionine (R)-S-oxide reductase
MGFQNTNTIFQSKEERYHYLRQALPALLVGESNFLANCANAIALIQSQFQFHWIGFYWVENETLVLGCFQGPVACTRIAKGKGVCGSAWELEKIQNVPNVDQFPGHIACSSLSKSELVIPLKSSAGKVLGVLDIDSEHLHSFDECDESEMSILMEILMKTLDA